MKRPELVVVVYLPPAFSAFEAVAPYEVLSLVPDSEIVFASRTGGLVSSDTGMVRLDSVPLSDVTGADVLYVPGGAILIDTGHPELLEEFRRLDRGSEYTSWACVGGWLPGAAGLLSGIRVADDNGVPMPAFGQVKVPGRVVVDGKYVSAGNTASTIDLALLLASKYVEAEDARAIQVGMEYDLDLFRPPFAPRPTQAVTPAERDRFLSLVMRGSRGKIVESLTS
ncbi:putative intracellular protease/amidase [Microbacterium sp. AK009]|uniref:DJ-1/PfpI family protein n=1 Tax=Microbacterium sp. AK009 TaxID=2723068 RepID=UPI0015C6B26C|nr:DJ-1/PfpI family protein [Microbacterium sp. AK009]NYF18046.1 putative intracellular protease/amidase [Microbacterium sp. AK009]